MKFLGGVPGDPCSSIVIHIFSALFFSLDAVGCFLAKKIKYHVPSSMRPVYFTPASGNQQKRRLTQIA